MSSGFVFHPDVSLDIARIWEHIADDDPDAADRMRERLYESIRALVPLPDQGHWRTDLASKSIRFQTVGNYLIAYAPDEKPLLILAVLHGSRSVRTLRALLRNRTQS
jgi:plasmid stabilization system protein ParE